MQPRCRIRGREPPPPPSSGGRYRRRSPSPRHHRRGRDPPPPSQQQRRSPDRQRRHEDRPPPDVLGAGNRRSRSDILLEAGRLAAHYLVAQGVLPEHLLQAREDPKHNPGSRPEPPAACGYARKRDDTDNDDDPKWRRNGGAGDCDRHKRNDDRLSRRSGWDRRSHSFDERRKYNDGGGGVDRGGRRSHEYDEQRRPTMSRSYSQNDRWSSSDGGVDRRRRSRSRSRSRTRTRSSNYGSRRDSDWRAGSSDLDHTKVPETGIVRDGDLDRDDADDVPRDLKASPRSVVVVETNEDASQAAATEDTEVKSEAEIIGIDRGQDNSGDDDGENTVSGSNDADVGEINVTQHQLSNSNMNVVHVSDEEPVSRQSQFSDAEGGMKAPYSPRDTCLIEPVAEEIRDEMEALQSEVKTDVGDLSKDEQELPAWYGIFDLNVVESQENSEVAEIASDPPLDDGCDFAPDLVGQMSQRANCGASETQGQGEHAVDNHQGEDAQVLINQSIGTHDFNKYNLDNEQRIGNQTDDEHGHDNHQLKDDEHKDDKHQMEMLLNQGHGTSVEVLDNYHMNGEQLLLDHGDGEHLGDDHPIKNEQLLLSPVLGVHDLNNYDLNSEQMLLHNGTDKQATESAWFQEGQMLIDQDADGQGALHNQGIGRMINVINLEDDYEGQSDTIQFLESK
ncbi:hypothetical protein GUJ93_ZPchr0004g40027 [Zizania palustris]|uniref:Uncharacterized protein n=1 Tax=Zizania palustris TaxID=103762 RepID=A0A8J5W049_ZIZPA|nr:hypothetical protein GUJ93_ZPchr0004g40027 [Zizania palustris]